jgi:hypothetical protein
VKQKSVVLALFVSAAVAYAAPLFTEDFNAEIKVKGRHPQAQSGLPLKHGYDAMPGWTRLGDDMPAHFVEQFPRDWALMLVCNKADQNVFTQHQGFAANEKGHVYAVTFDTGPAVYQGLSQATLASDQFAIELLREDGTVLKRHPVTPGKWDGLGVLKNQTLSYTGDGAGLVRFRIAPVFTSGTRFYGAIDNLQVFDSKEEAESTVKHRLANAEQEREQLIQQRKRQQETAIQRRKKRQELAASLTGIEKDWLLQAKGEPSPKHVQDEILWARELAERLANMPEGPDFTAEFKQLADLEAQLQGEGADAMELYLAVRRVKRTITFKNPVVDFSKVLLVDNPYPTDRHESAHRHGYRAGGGRGRLLVLEGLTPDSPVRSLVPEEKAGFLWRPDLSFDAKKIVFCLMPNGEKSFHLYEVNVDPSTGSGQAGTGFKQLTFGDYDDLDPIYLPDGKLLFTSTRANSYVRCGPTHHSPVLSRCDADGKNIYVVSRNMEPDFLPSLLPDGRVIYTRWEYTDKEQKRLQSLWTMNPDGTGVIAYWGNQSVWPDIQAEPRSIPGTGTIMFTGVGHHKWFKGSIGIIDPSKGMNYPDGLSRVTTEIRWPEVGNGPEEKAEVANYRPGPYPAYKTPYPIGKEDFLVSILNPKTKKFCLYLMDLQGNRELIYAGQHNVWHAMPLKPREKPPMIPDRVAWPKIGPEQPPLTDGVLYSANVFEGNPLLPRDKVKQMRVLSIDAKTYSPWKKTYQHSGPSISITQADGVKRILGTTPVEADGSVCFKVPPGIALHFQLLDKDFRCIQTMRTFTGVMPGEMRGCVGCHEGRSNTPVNTSGGIAMRRGPLELTPPPWGREATIGYTRFVQPVLDRYCGSCHQGEGNARKKLDLTFRPSKVTQFTEPYVTLVGGGNNWYHPTKRPLNKAGHPITISGVINVEGYRERSPVALATLDPMTHMSSASLLIDKAMDKEHIKAEMDAESLRQLIGWVDANGPYLGEEEIRQMPDPTPQTRWAKPVPVVQPRLKTAPTINRFNIRQDGDSSKVFHGAPLTGVADPHVEAKGHPFVICDIHKKQIMKVNAKGEVVWTYPGARVHDLWALKNGNILFSGPVTGVVEVSPDKKEVWHFNSKVPGGQVYACQPLPNGDVMVGIEGKPSRIVEVGRDGTIKKTITLQTKGPIRLSRKTHTGTYLVAERKESSIHEYDADSNLIRRIQSKGAVFMAARLKNGNTLIGNGTGHELYEVDPDDKVVWKVGEHDLPGIPIRDAAGFQRLPNGNTVLCNWGGHGHIGEQTQIIEITPEKEVVWKVFRNSVFATPLHIQLLDVEGDPAKGELIR